MLDLLLQVTAALACAAITAGVPILLPRLLTMIAANIHQKDVALIADAAARAAGRVAVSVADQMAGPGGSLKSAIAIATATEVTTLKRQLPQVIAKVGASDNTLSSMIAGGVGRLVAQKAESPAPPAPAATGLTLVRGR